MTAMPGPDGAAAAETAAKCPVPGTPGEVFRAFLALGLGSFGGPIAHLGYFRTAFVERRRWLGEAEYAELVALCQFLPGPASSQTGFALGLMRAGLPGALAAWAGFTLPSALLMLGFAFAARSFTGPLAGHAMHGLKLVAVAVVAQAVWGMARTLAADRPRAAIALAATLVVTFAPAALGQLASILLGAASGALLALPTAAAGGRPLASSWSRGKGAVALALFLILLLGLPLAARLAGAQWLALADVFYRAGSLVFGGGHVVLPLLESEIVPRHWLGEAEFLAGYGAAQAVPGPLFTFAAYLGAAVQPPPHGVAGAALALVAIFLPGLLLAMATLPFWEVVRARPLARSAIAGVNAAVVGILLAALYDPVWVAAVREPADFAVAAIGFALLAVWRTPPWVIVLLTLAAALALGLG